MNSGVEYKPSSPGFAAATPRNQILTDSRDRSNKNVG